MTLFSIMSLKNRKSSQDNLSPTQSGPGVVRRNSSLLSNKRWSNPSQSPETAEPEISLREQNLAEEYLTKSDGFVNSNTFLKYNKTFHKLFPEVPEEDRVTHTFTCSLQKEVLYHGKLFVSECHVCFYSSVLLKETKVVIPFSDVKEIKKYKSPLSMLSIQTSSRDKYSFASVRNYKLCYKLLHGICSQSQEESGNSSPQLSPAENEAERDTVSSCSSLEIGMEQDFFSSDLEREFPLMTSEVSSTPGSTQQRSLTNKDHRAAPLNRSTETVTPSVSREVTHFSMLFYIYVTLLLLLLLVSGYIGLRITALEEQLSSLGALADLY
nr:GRAM domain-containing protein 2B [Nothobranchius furzeri]